MDKEKFKELITKAYIAYDLCGEIRSRLYGKGIMINSKQEYSLRDIKNDDLRKKAERYNELHNLISSKSILEFGENDFVLSPDEIKFANSDKEQVKEITNMLANAYEKKNEFADILSKANLKVNEKGLYNLNNIDDKELKKLAEGYNDLSKILNNKIGYWHKTSVDYKKESKKVNKILKKSSSVMNKMETRKAKEEKKETKKGNFGEVVSCLFGQVDKRLYNFGKKYLSPLRKYSMPAIIGLGLVAASIFLTPAGVTGALLSGGITIGAIGGIVTVSTLGFAVYDMIKIKNNPATVTGLKEITKGKYFDNLKKAWTKFRKPKELNKDNTKKNNGVLNPENPEGKEFEDDRAKDVKNLSDLIMNLSYDNYQENKKNISYIRAVYGKYENQLDDECKKRWRFWDELLKTVSLFKASVENLINGTDNRAVCDKYYDILIKACGNGDVEKGKVNLEKIIPEILEKYYAYIKDVKENNRYIDYCVNMMNSFTLEDTKKSVEDAEQKILPLFNKYNAVELMKNNALYKDAYERYCNLKKGVEYRSNVFAFRDLMVNSDFSILDYDTYVMLKEDLVRLTEDKEQLTVFAKIMKSDRSFKNKYADFIKHSRQFILKDKVDILNVENKVGKENDYKDVDMIAKMAIGYDRRNGRAKGLEKMDNSLNEYSETVSKLNDIKDLRSNILVDGYEMECDLIFDKNGNIKATYTDYLENEKTLYLKTKFDRTISYDDNLRKCINEISRLTFVPANQIKLRFSQEDYMFREKNGSRGSRR